MDSLIDKFPRLAEKEDSHSDSKFLGEKQDKFEDCLSKLKISNLELIEKHKLSRLSKQPTRQTESHKRLWTILNKDIIQNDKIGETSNDKNSQDEDKSVREKDDISQGKCRLCEYLLKQPLLIPLTLNFYNLYVF